MFEDEARKWVCKKGHAGDPYVTPGGYSRCRVCRNTYRREYYKRDKHKREEVARIWRRKNRERIRELSYKRRDPVKHKARQAVNNAVALGKFQKSDCHECGQGKVNFHHTHGYDKPNWFTGVWLCTKHHAGVHKVARDKLREELANV